jgi:predicted nuclease of predicted toxin-antitoxin system
MGRTGAGMKFLVDECTGTSVVACLRDEGHDAMAVVELMPEANDEEILARAVAEGRIVVTNDKDFGEMVFRSGLAHRGVVLLRLRDERAENKVRMMKVVLAQVGERLRNHYVVATEAGIRVRK